MPLVQGFVFFVNGASVLNFLSYDDKEELYNLSWLKEENKCTALCPQPLLADSLRGLLGNRVQVLTISRFVSEKLQLAYPEGELALQTKAEIFLFLSALWRKKFSDKPIETFEQAFKLFTELRSFSLDFQLVEEILPEFEKTVANAVKFFWLVFDELGLLDEHKSYALLAEAYRSMDNLVNEEASLTGEGERYILWGFSHLSSLQVDFLKALSLRHDILIPLPQSVFTSLKNSDWPAWLGAQVQEERKTKEKRELQTLFFSRGKLGEKIKLFLENHPDPFDVLLTSEKVELNHYLELPLFEHFYKSGIDLWEGEFEKVSCFLFEQENFEKSLKEKILKAQKEKRFSELKILFLYKKANEDWKNLSSDHHVLTLFDKMILKKVALLNLPRNFFFPIHAEKKGDILSLKELPAHKKEKKVIVCVNSHYEDLKGGSETYSHRVIEFLSAIGPLKRKDFSFAFLKHELLKVLTKKETILFLEEGLIDHSLSWSDILENFELRKIQLNEFENKRRASPLEERPKEKFPEKISATILQTYLDCPQKYYYTYLEPIVSRVELEESLASQELGVLEHELVEKYLLTEAHLDFSLLRELAIDIFDRYLKMKNKKLNVILQEKFFLEVLTFAQKGILSLLELKKIWPDLQYKFEEKISFEKNGFKFSGSMDCLILTKQGWGLLDFKRTKSSIPSKSKLENFESLQVPFYLFNQSLSIEECLFFGHVSLSTNEESQVFARNDEIKEKLNGTDFLGKKNAISFSFNKKEYLKFEKELLEKLKSDKNFFPQLRDVKTCEYCDLKNICTKGLP